MTPGPTGGYNGAGVWGNTLDSHSLFTPMPPGTAFPNEFSGGKPPTNHFSNPSYNGGMGNGAGYTHFDVDQHS